MPSTREAILDALAAQVATVSGIPVQRNASLPERVGPQGLLIQRDGSPGEPDVTLNPRREYYAHRVEFEAFVQPRGKADAEPALDGLLVNLGMALAHDRSIGGRVEMMTPRAPEIQPLDVEGGAPFLAAIVAVILEYQLTDPLTG